jgi:hypothetical protein
MFSAILRPLFVSRFSKTSSVAHFTSLSIFATRQFRSEIAAGIVTSDGALPVHATSASNKMVGKLRVDIGDKHRMCARPSILQNLAKHNGIGGQCQKACDETPRRWYQRRKVEFARVL